MTGLDKRLHAWRDDLADVRLDGNVAAKRFVAGARRQVAAGCAPLRGAAAPGAMLVSELLFGETVLVFEEKDGAAWVQCESDGYVGYTESAALGADIHTPTHAVSAILSCIFPEPHIRAPVRTLLPMGARVAVVETKGRYCRLATGGWTPAQHIAANGEFESDFVTVAERFMGVPYVWGGKSSHGMDCSGLTQIALRRCGVDAPRDSDMQEAALGSAVPFDGDESVLQRGDLVFWPGHMGVYHGDGQLLHANATDMCVALAPLADVIAWIMKVEGNPVSSVRRIS
jgi:cell wall-associated NlpC family hydrolase